MLLLFFFHLALSIERPTEFGERGLPRFYAVSCRLKKIRRVGPTDAHSEEVLLINVELIPIIFQ